MAVGGNTEKEKPGRRVKDTVKVEGRVTEKCKLSLRGETKEENITLVSLKTRKH